MVDIDLSHTKLPAGLGGERVNWLPVPEGGFVLMLRLYLPRQDVIEDDYQLPPMERLDAIN